MNKLLKPYRNKLAREALVKSLLAALASSGVFGGVFLLIMHLISEEPDTLTLTVSFAAPFVCAFLISFFLIYMPDVKKTAARIDETGLKERISTMVELRDEKTGMAALQRDDAITHLKATAPKAVKYKIGVKRVILSVSAAAVALCLAFVPYNIMDIFAADGEGELSAEDKQTIQELLDALKDKVEQAEVSDELKEKLEDVVSELEESLSEGGSALEQAAKISQAEDEIDRILSEAITRTEIGAALMQFDSTRALGRAISKGDTDGVTAALEAMKSETLALTDQELSDILRLVSSDVASALELSGVEAGDSLYDALAAFSSALSSAADKNDAGNDATSDIQAAYDTANAAIIAALEEQAKIEKTAEELAEAMDGAKDELFGNEQTGEETGQEPQGEQTGDESGEKPEGEQTGEKPDGEQSGDMSGELPDGELSGGEGGGDDILGQMSEGIYDPTLGDVEYGEVYAAYYAQYLAALEKGEVPEDLQQIIDEYFASLNK